MIDPVAALTVLGDKCQVVLVGLSKLCLVVAEEGLIVMSAHLARLPYCELAFFFVGSLVVKQVVAIALPG